LDFLIQYLISVHLFKTSFSNFSFKNIIAEGNGNIEGGKELVTIAQMHEWIRQISIAMNFLASKKVRN